MSVRASVIIPTFNRSDSLRRLLDALAFEHAAFPSFEVVVTDDGSTDGTPEALGRTSAPYTLKVVRQSNRGPGAARNAALRVAEGEIAIFLDDDVVPQSGLVAKHVEAHAGHPNLVVIGAMEPHDQVATPWAAWELRTVERSYDAMTAGAYAPTPRQFFTANASLRRAHVSDAGWFNESMLRAEDVELAYRLEDAGCRFIFRRDIRVWHEPRRSYEEWLRVARLYGQYDVTMWRDMGREHILRNIAEEYPARNHLIRAAARLCVGRASALALVRTSVRTIAVAAHRGRLGTLSLGVLSFVFNLEYWDGVAGELGGREAFWHAVDHPAPAPIRAASEAVPTHDTRMIES